MDYVEKSRYHCDNNISFVTKIFQKIEKFDDWSNSWISDELTEKSDDPQLILI